MQVGGAAPNFTGTIVKPTTFSDCAHPVGEVIWRITKTATGYAGTHAWFGSGPPECKHGAAAYRGSATWAVVGSGTSLQLHFCTTNPTDSSDTRCNDLTRTKPVAAPWPRLPNALVTLASVSNGCGGGLGSNEPRFGDTSTYVDSNDPLGTRYSVDFRLACDVHDAGYSGAKIRDPFSRRVVDFFGWSQLQVDKRFLGDMRTLCDRAFAGKDAPVALADCKGHGGKRSWGAESRFDYVRATGRLLFRRRPNVRGVWTGGQVRVVISQRSRAVHGTWRDGDATGVFRGTLISLDQDSVVKGFARKTVNGETKQYAFRLGIDPDHPNGIVFSGAALHGTMSR